MPAAGRGGRTRVAGPELAAAPLVSLSLAGLLRAGIVLLLIVAGGAAEALPVVPLALPVRRRLSSRRRCWSPPPVVPPPWRGRRGECPPCCPCR